MDRFEGRGWLDWWANSSTCLGSAEVNLTIRWAGQDWDARGGIVANGDLEGFAFLCALDPVFRLRLGEDDTLAVVVEPTDERGGFTLTEYLGPDERPFSIDLPL